MIRDLPHVARAARALADESRLRLLTLLLEGEATVTDLVTRSGLPQPRISSQLAALREAGLVSVRSNGRQRTYHTDAHRLRRALDALAALAPEGAPLPPRGKQAAREVVRDSALRRARTCYDHLAGVAGVALLDELLRRGWLLRRGDRPDFSLTDDGTRGLVARGIDLERAAGAKRSYAHGCLDWTERRHHLGGALGAEIVRTLERDGTLVRLPESRAVELARPALRWLDVESTAGEAS